jgi:hypothetical protein
MRRSGREGAGKGEGNKEVKEERNVPGVFGDFPTSTSVPLAWVWAPNFVGFVVH